MKTFRTSAGTISLNGFTRLKGLGRQADIYIPDDGVITAEMVDQNNMEIYSPQQTLVAAHAEQTYQEAIVAGVEPEVAAAVVSAAITVANQAIEQKSDPMASYQAVVELVLPTLNQPLSVTLFQEPPAPISPEQALQVVTQAQEAVQTAIDSGETKQVAAEAFNTVIETVKESQRQPDPPAPAPAVAESVKNDLVQQVTTGQSPNYTTEALMSMGLNKKRVLIGLGIAVAITAGVVIYKRSKKKKAA